MALLERELVELQGRLDRLAQHPIVHGMRGAEVQQRYREVRRLEEAVSRKKKALDLARERAAEDVHDH